MPDIKVVPNDESVCLGVESRNTPIKIINEELFFIEADVKRFTKLSKHMKNFIRKQETQDGHIKRVFGRHACLMRRVAEINGYPFSGFRVSASLKAIFEANRKHKPGLLLGVGLNGQADGKRVYQAIECWIDDYRRMITSTEYRALERNQNLNCVRRKKIMMASILSAINAYGRILIVRVDLAYSNTHQSLRDISSDCEKLRRNLNKNRALSQGFISGIIKIEFGISKGPHAHLIMLYDGNARWRDDGVGEIIGNYWRDVITDGNGVFFNSNRKSSKNNMAERMGVPVELLAIGMIKRTDSDKLKNLEVLLDYLSKDEQRICALGGRNFRSLRIFSLPRSKSKRGGE